MLVTDVLESRVVTPAQSRSGKKAQPDWKQLPLRVDRSLWLPLVTMLEAYVEKQAAPPSDGKALTDEQKAGSDRANSILVQSTFSPLPGLLLSRLKSNPSGPVAEQLLALLAKYWAARLGRTRLRSYQCSPRGGSMELELDGDSLSTSSHAVIVLEGSLRV